MQFEEWLATCPSQRGGGLLKPATIKHYVDGVKVISDEAINTKLISERLENMTLCELDLAISVIFNVSWFIEKDTKGNKMYSNAIKRYRCYKFLTSEDGIKEEKQVTVIKNDVTLTETEKNTIIKARIGQGIYREKILRKYNNQCIMTGIDLKQVLVASHIKPWAVCNNIERLSEDNGLLLSATYDRLFDSGLITFEETGKMKISSMISLENRKRLNIDKNDTYDIKYNSAMKSFLDYHQKNIFVA